MLVWSIHQVEVAQALPSAQAPTEIGQLALRRQISHVLKMGKPLAPALLAYAQELPPGRRRRRLQRFADQLEQGYDPAHEFAAGQIDEEWIPLLIAGASSGDPSRIPSEIIDEFQRAGDYRGQFAAALAYPLLLLPALLVLLLFLTWWITPTFQELFNDFNTDLPAPTDLLLRVSDIIRDSRGLVVLIPALALALVILFFGIGPRSAFRACILHRIPILGPTVRLSEGARFTRYLADLMEADVPVADALRISGRNAGRTALRREVMQLAAAMDLSNADLRVSPPVFQSVPHTVVHALQLQTNPRAAALILRELSWMYDQQTRNRLAWISSLVEPALIVLLGTIVGFYVVALFMPLVSLVHNLS